MKNRKINFKYVAQRALLIAPQLVEQMLPSGRREGNEWVALNPLRHDRSLGSFRINLSTGRWADFAVDATGSDLISLAAYIYGITQYQAAIRLDGRTGARND